MIARRSHGFPHEAHARGDLFRQVKGRKISEVQYGDIVVAEDAADNEANEEDDADEGLLVEEFGADEGAVVEHAGAAGLWRYS